MNFSIISAIDKNRGIGIGGQLPWHLKGDMEHFRLITTECAPGKQNAVIMGSTTWASLPEKFRPLPQRINVVLSRRQDLPVPNGVLVATSIDEALRKLQGTENKLGDIFVIGGASVYAESILHSACNKLYLTEIDKVFNCDTFFPLINQEIFSLVSRSEPVTEGDVSYHYSLYQKK